MFHGGVIAFDQIVSLLSINVPGAVEMRIILVVDFANDASISGGGRRQSDVRISGPSPNCLTLNRVAFILTHAVPSQINAACALTLWCRICPDHLPSHSVGG